MTLLIRNAAQVVCVARNGERAKRGSALRDVGIVPNGAVVVRDDRIVWVGPTAETPPTPEAELFDATGKVVLPGFIDSHTHLVFTGARAAEFEERLEGRTYQEISARGGGILSSVRSVRAASRDDLARATRQRLARCLAFGVTTVEVKSGYGLNFEDELKCLEVVADLNREGPLELVPTFLGAHALPPEFQDDREGYLRLLIDDLLPAVASCRLAEFCDVFCEEGVFSVAESERILIRARELGLGRKVHADEFSPLGGAELAVRIGAVSADHLLRITEQGIAALAASDTVATLLPGTAFFLGLPFAPARTLVERGAIVALATDCNPGTCPSENLPLIGSMACSQMRLLPAEALTAMTLNAAAALGRSDRLGSLEPGKQADLVVCDISDYRHLFYHLGVNHVGRVYKRGRLAYQA